MRIGRGARTILLRAHPVLPWLSVEFQPFLCVSSDMQTGNRGALVRCLNLRRLLTNLSGQPLAAGFQPSLETRELV